MNTNHPLLLKLGAACALAVWCALSVSGCVSKSKAQAMARDAFMAGQQHERAQQARGPSVTFIGPVRNPLIPWNPELTLAHAIVAAGYALPADPRTIVIIRNGEGIPFDPARLLKGEDMPLLAGDTVKVE